MTADFGPEIELTLFLHMRAKEIAKSLGTCIPIEVIPLLQEIRITNANDKVRFLTSGPIYKESKVSPKCVISFS